jgi:UDP-N-acetylmuramoyl-tripeptide--D-alanyl-D-alanine ligase
MNNVTLTQILIWTGGWLLSAGRTLHPEVADPAIPSTTEPSESVRFYNDTTSAGLTNLVRFRNVSTDTRSVGPDDLFLALRGSRFDGHGFLDQAIAAGVAGLVIDEASLAVQADFPAAQPLAVIVVADTLKALQAIAAGYRLTLHAPVIGITGSVGKTSTRGMVAACLGAAWQVCQTEANNNNEIGLPKTLLSATADDQAVILEMGMRGRGEIELLSQIAHPDIALITNIGLAHIERLGSQEEILNAKAEIIAGLGPGGLLILNADDPYLKKLGLELQDRFRVAFVATRPLEDQEQNGLAVYLAEAIVVTEQTSHFNLLVHPARPDAQPLAVSLPVPGHHMVSNSLFGLAVADALGIDLAVAAAGAANFTTTGNRQRLLAAGPIMVMDDSYNASPESMQAALETLRTMAGSRRLVAALGGMLELGDFAPAAHRCVGQAAAKAGYSLVLAIGPYAPDLVAGYRTLAPGCKTETYVAQPDLIASLLELLQPGDALLVKGSRGFAMEQVTRAVVDHFSKPEVDRPDKS